MFWGMPWRKQKPGGRNCGSRLPPQAPGGETFGTGTFAPPWLPGGMGTRQWFVFPPNQAASGVQIQSHLLPSPTPGLSLWDPTSPSFPSFGLSKGNALAFGTGKWTPTPLPCRPLLYRPCLQRRRRRRRRRLGQQTKHTRRHRAMRPLLHQSRRRRAVMRTQTTC